MQIKWTLLLGVVSAGVLKNAAYELADLAQFVGHKDFEGHRAVVYSAEEAGEWIYDVFTGKKIRPAGRAGSASSSEGSTTASSSSEGTTLASQSPAAPDSKLTIPLRTKKCLNQELGNPESGMCDYHPCGFSNSTSCKEAHFDCCTQKLQDTNGRWECAWAVCKKTTLLLTDYENGGCCS